MHGLIFETSVCYWQNQPGCYLSPCAPTSLQANKCNKRKSRNTRTKRRKPPAGSIHRIFATRSLALGFDTSEIRSGPHALGAQSRIFSHAKLCFQHQLRKTCAPGRDANQGARPGCPQALLLSRRTPREQSSSRAATNQQAGSAGARVERAVLSSPVGPFASKCKQTHRSLLSSLGLRSHCLRIQRITARPFPIVFARCRSHGPSLEPAQCGTSYWTSRTRIAANPSTSTKRLESH